MSSVDFACGVMRSLLVLPGCSLHDCVKNSKEKTNILLKTRLALGRFIPVYSNTSFIFVYLMPPNLPTVMGFFCFMDAMMISEP